MIGLLENLQWSFTGLALALAVLFVRHRKDGPNGSFSWLGASFGLFALNHVITLKQVRVSGLTDSLPFDLATAAATLASLLVGLVLYADRSPPRWRAGPAALFVLAFVGISALLLGARQVQRNLVHVAPALVLGYGAVLQFRDARQHPGDGHGLAALVLAAHPVAFVLLNLAGVNLYVLQGVLSFFYVAAAVALFSITLRRSQREQRRANQELAETNRELARSKAELETVNGSLEERVAAREREIVEAQRALTAAAAERSRFEERERILADVHDGFGTQLAMAKRSLDSGPVDQERIAELLRESLDDLRLVVDTLHHREDGIASAIFDFRYRCDRRLRRHGLVLEWKLDVERAPPMPSRLVLQVLRILQEGLNNGLQHAGASLIGVEVTCPPEGPFTAVIRDDGVGLPDSPAGGRGLTSMQRRAETIGANLSVRRREPSPGTEVVLELPLAPVTESRAG